VEYLVLEKITFHSYNVITYEILYLYIYLLHKNDWRHVIEHLIIQLFR